MLLFTALLASPWEEHKMGRAKEVTRCRDGITARTTALNCSSSRIYLFDVGFCLIPRESPSEPHQILVVTVVSCREWPVKSQWSKCKWNGADTENCRERRGCISLHDQILTSKSQQVRNPSRPGNLAAGPEAMRQGTRVQGGLHLMGAAGRLNSTEIGDGNDKTRSVAPFTRGQRNTTGFLMSSPAWLKARWHLEGPKEFGYFLEG